MLYFLSLNPCIHVDRINFSLLQARREGAFSILVLGNQPMNIMFMTEGLFTGLFQMRSLMQAFKISHIIMSFLFLCGIHLRSKSQAHTVFLPFKRTEFRKDMKVRLSTQEKYSDNILKYTATHILILFLGHELMKLIFE